MTAASRLSRRLILAGAGAACAAAPLGLAAAQLTHLSVGTVPTDAGMPPYFALRGGFFRRNGLDVDVQFMSSGSAMGAAVIGGSLQIGGTTVMSLIAPHVKGVPFQIIGPGNVYLSEKPSELLVVRKDSPISHGRRHERQN